MSEYVYQDLDTTVSIAGQPYLPTELTVESSRYNETDMVTGTVVPDDHPYKPDEEDTAHVSINGLPVFSGFVGDINDNSDGSYGITFFNAIHRLKTHSVTISVDELTLASELLENHIFQKANVSEYTLSIAPYSIPGGIDAFLQSSAPRDTPIAIDRTNTPADKVVDEIAKLTNSVWWVDRQGVLQFGSPETAQWDLAYILDIEAGDSTATYQSVKVTGDNAVSGQGWQARNLISKETAVAQRTLRKLGASPEERAEATASEAVNVRVENGIAEGPTFGYKSKDAKTQAQVDAIADRLIEKLAQQMVSGYVEVVGRPEIQVYDVIHLPPAFGGAEYMVSGVEHRVDGQQGYRTRIHIGGLLTDG